MAKTTKLADETATDAATGKKVANPELAEFCEIFGRERGYDLYQSGESIDDARKYKELLDKFGLPPAPDAPAETPRGETTPLSGGHEDGQVGKQNLSFAQQIKLTASKTHC